MNWAKTLIVGGLVLATVFLLSAVISVAAPYLAGIIIIWTVFKIVQMRLDSSK